MILVGKFRVKILSRSNLIHSIGGCQMVRLGPLGKLRHFCLLFGCGWRPQHHVEATKCWCWASMEFFCTHILRKGSRSTNQPTLNKLLWL